MCKNVLSWLLMSGADISLCGLGRNLMLPLSWSILRTLGDSSPFPHFSAAQLSRWSQNALCLTHPYASLRSILLALGSCMTTKNRCIHFPERIWERSYILNISPLVSFLSWPPCSFFRLFSSSETIGVTKSLTPSLGKMMGWITVKNLQDAIIL